MKDSIKEHHEKINEAKTELRYIYKEMHKTTEMHFWYISAENKQQRKRMTSEYLERMKQLNNKADIERRIISAQERAIKKLLYTK